MKISASGLEHPAGVIAQIALCSHRLCRLGTLQRNHLVCVRARFLWPPRLGHLLATDDWQILWAPFVVYLSTQSSAGAGTTPASEGLGRPDRGNGIPRSGSEPRYDKMVKGVDLTDGPANMGVEPTDGICRLLAGWF